MASDGGGFSKDMERSAEFCRKHRKASLSKGRDAAATLQSDAAFPRGAQRWQGRPRFHLPAGSAVGFEAGPADAHRCSSPKAPTMPRECSFYPEPNQPTQAGAGDLRGSKQPRSHTAAFQPHPRDPGPWPRASHFIKCS